MKEVCIIGGGPVGLFTAASLVNQFKVTVIDNPSQNATYHAAAAFWLPFASGASESDAERFGWPTWDYYQQLLEAGVQGILKTHYIGYETSQTETYPHDPMSWLAKPQYRDTFRYEKIDGVWSAPIAMGPEDGITSGHYRFREAWRIASYSIHPKVFLLSFRDYLHFHHKSKLVFEYPTQQPVTLADLKSDSYRQFASVVLCRGVRGWEEDPNPAEDTTLSSPKKGILARVRCPLKPFDKIRLIGDGPFESHPVYVVPHQDGLAFGGTVVEASLGSRDARVIEAHEKLALINRVCKVFGSKQGDRYRELLTGTGVEWQVGIRPKRSNGPQVNYAGKPLGDDGPHVFVNNGHGGSGFTFGYGTGQHLASQIKMTLS